MEDNRSLEEFIPEESGDAGDEGAGDTGDEGASDPVGSEGSAPDAGGGRTNDADESEADARDPTSAPDPVRPTYVWSPEGGACAACGRAVERRWRDGETLVCGDCKEW